MRVGFGWIKTEEKDQGELFTVALCRNCHQGIVIRNLEIDHTVNCLTWPNKTCHCCKSPDYHYISLTTDLEEIPK